MRSNNNSKHMIIKSLARGISALVIIMVSTAIGATEPVDTILTSAQWTKFKEALLKQDIKVTHLGSADDYCVAQQAKQKIAGGIDSQTQLFDACAKAVITGLESNSQVFRESKNGEPKPRRAEVVEVRALSPDSLYIRATTLLPDGHLEVLRKIQALEIEHKTKYRLVILDLRGNGGGSLMAVGQHAAIYSSAGREVVSFTEKSGQKSTIKTSLDVLPPLNFRKKVDGTVPKIRSDLERARIAVIIDRDTGSGAEALTYFMQQRKMPIFGENSAGFASVYSLAWLGEDLYIKIHIGEMLSGNGRNWSGSGVTPDIQITEPKGSFENHGSLQHDPWLQLVLKTLHED